MSDHRPTDRDPATDPITGPTTDPITGPITGDPVTGGPLPHTPEQSKGTGGAEVYTRPDNAEPTTGGGRGGLVAILLIAALVLILLVVFNVIDIPGL